MRLVIFLFFSFYCVISVPTVHATAKKTFAAQYPRSTTQACAGFMTHQMAEKTPFSFSFTLAGESQTWLFMDETTRLPDYFIFGCQRPKTHARLLSMSTNTTCPVVLDRSYHVESELYSIHTHDYTPLRPCPDFSDPKFAVLQAGSLPIYYYAPVRDRNQKRIDANKEIVAQSFSDNYGFNATSFSDMQRLEFGQATYFVMTYKRDMNIKKYLIYEGRVWDIGDTLWVFDGPTFVSVGENLFAMATIGTPESGHVGDVLMHLDGEASAFIYSSFEFSN